jgi:hypothetical protein
MQTVDIVRKSQAFLPRLDVHLDDAIHMGMSVTHITLSIELGGGAVVC